MYDGSIEADSTGYESSLRVKAVDVFCPLPKLASHINLISDVKGVSLRPVSNYDFMQNYPTPQVIKEVRSAARQHHLLVRTDEPETIGIDMSPIQILCLVALDKHQRLATNNSFVIHRRTMVCSSPTTTLNQSSNCYGVVRQPKMNSSLYQTTSIFNLFGQVLLQRSNLSTLMIWAQFPPYIGHSWSAGVPKLDSPGVGSGLYVRQVIK